MMSMRGASAEAVAALRERLDSVLSGADAERVGDDLFSVATLLRSDAALRRVVTDVSIPAEAKQGLARDLLDGKVAAESLELVSNAVGEHWTRTRDLADTLERLGEVAVVKSAGANAERLGDELFTVAQLVNDSPALRDALSDPARSDADKADLIGGLLGDKALPATVKLAQQALASSYRTVSVALAEYQKVAAEVHGESVAKVRSARQLSDDEQDRLSQALQRQYGRPIHLNVVVDPELVGGLRVEIGDDVIDGSVSSRLDEARRRLAG
jgi:F-type H+-transporting ATPase subunit delta